MIQDARQFDTFGPERANASHVENCQTIGASPYLICYPARPQARVRLVCFAHAGGSASIFAAWQHQVPRDIEVVGIQLPGREGRRGEPHIPGFSMLLSELKPVLVSLCAKPLILFGYSLGALIAFECARALRRYGAPPPTKLLVAACRAPDHIPRTNITSLPQRDFIGRVVERYGGIPQSILEDPELLEYFLPVLQADLRILESYQYTAEPPLDCPICAYGGSDDPRILALDIEAWKHQTRATFSSRLFPGGHFFINGKRDAFVRTLVNDIREVADVQHCEHAAPNDSICR